MARHVWRVDKSPGHTHTQKSECVFKSSSDYQWVKSLCIFLKKIERKNLLGSKRKAINIYFAFLKKYGLRSELVKTIIRLLNQVIYMSFLFLFLVLFSIHLSYILENSQEMQYGLCLCTCPVVSVLVPNGIHACAHKCKCHSDYNPSEYCHYNSSNLSQIATRSHHLKAVTHCW